MTNTTIEFNRADELSIVNITAVKMEMEIELLRERPYYDRDVVKVLEDNHKAFMDVCREVNLRKLNDYTNSIVGKVDMKHFLLNIGFPEPSETELNLEKGIFDMEVERLTRTFMELKKNREETAISLEDLEREFPSQETLHFAEETEENNLGTGYSGRSLDFIIDKDALARVISESEDRVKRIMDSGRKKRELSMV